MKQLLYKEFKLALHPTAVIFLALSAMLLIPNYPYYVTFFYTCLGVFFICLNGRENRDIYYSMLLPIRKRQIVKARFLMVAALQLAQAVLGRPLRNPAGTDKPGRQSGGDGRKHLLFWHLLSDAGPL